MARRLTFYKPPDKDRCFFNIVGENHRMDTIHDLVRRAKRKNRTKTEGWTKVGVVLWLIPEPTNRYDSNAIKVCATSHGNHHVGYIPATAAERWTGLIKNPISIKGIIVGKQRRWGIKLDVDDLKAAKLPRRWDVEPG